MEDRTNVGGDERQGETPGSVLAPARPAGRLVGETRPHIDRKGRLLLGSAFRPHFAEGGYLMGWQGTCLALHTPAGFERWIATIRGQAANMAPGGSGPSIAAIMRDAYRRAELVEPDPQGRFIIPPRFRDLAPLDADVVLIGALDRVELWLPERLEGESASAASLIELSMDAYEGYDR